MKDNFKTKSDSPEKTTVNISNVDPATYHALKDYSSNLGQSRGESLTKAMKAVIEYENDLAPATSMAKIKISNVDKEIYEKFQRICRDKGRSEGDILGEGIQWLIEDDCSLDTFNFLQAEYHNISEEKDRQNQNNLEESESTTQLE